MRDITLWDADSIESHNIANQLYSNSMIGKDKAKCLAKIIKDNTGTKCATKGWWDGEELSGLVFSCVDSMDTRKAIMEKTTGMFIETRMGVFHGEIYSIDTSKEDDVNFWLSRWTSDDEIADEKSACGSSLTIGSTAALLSSLSAWQGIHYIREEQPKRGILVSVNPFLMEEL